MISNKSRCSYFFSIDRWLVPCPKEGMKSGHPQLNLPHQLSKPYIKNNSIYLIFVCFFVFINLTLFITRGIQFRKSNFLVIFARACGELFPESFQAQIINFYFRTMSQLQLCFCSGSHVTSNLDILENARIGSFSSA